MVPETGIEPVTLSLEGFCSSTELPGQKQSSERISRKEKKSNRIYTKKFSSIIREFDCLCTYNTLYTEPFIFNLSLFSKILAYIYSSTWSHEVPSTQQSLTSVFGKGTGVPSALYTPRSWKKESYLKFYKEKQACFILFPTYSEIIFIPTFYQIEIWRIKSRTKSMYKYRSCY